MLVWFNGVGFALLVNGTGQSRGLVLIVRRHHLQYKEPQFVHRGLLDHGHVRLLRILLGLYQTVDFRSIIATKENPTMLLFVPKLAWDDLRVLSIFFYW